jgi:hypothetical protein
VRLRPGGRAESLEHVYRMLDGGSESFLQRSHQHAVCNPLRSLRWRLGAACRLLKLPGDSSALQHQFAGSLQEKDGTILGGYSSLRPCFEHVDRHGFEVLA